MLILGGSGIITYNIASKGGRSFEYGFLPLHSPQIMHDPIPRICDSLLTLISESGSNYATFCLAYEGCQYVSYA